MRVGNDNNGSKNRNAKGYKKYGKSESSGITEIPDDIPRKHINESKRRLARFIKRIDDKRSGAEKIKLTPLSGIITIILILAIVFVAADLSSGGFLSTVNGKVASVFSRRLSEKFSVSTDAHNVFDFKAFEKGYIIVTENGISYVNSSGNISARQQLSYSSPSVEINGGRALIYDRGNTSYTLERDKSVNSQMTAEGNITDAAVSRRDNYAIAVTDESYQSVLYGLNASGKIIYRWNCPDGYITDVAITDSGGKAAVTVLDSENAVLSSKLYILDFEYDTAYAEFDYTDETVIGAKFISGKKVQVITDKKVYLIKGKEQTAVYDYGSSDIVFGEIGSDKYTAVITTDYSHDDKYTLAIFSNGGGLKSEASLSGKVRGLSSSKKSVAVLFSDKIETYSKRGKLVGCTRDINYYDDIVLNGNYIYLLSSENVKKYPAYGSPVNEEEVSR